MPGPPYFPGSARMFWLFPGIPATFRVFTTRSVYSIEPLAVLQTSHDPTPIIYLNLKFSIMEYQSSSREWLIAEIESELSNGFAPFDLDAWTIEDLENMYNSIIKSR